jgi:RNA polymerase sigma-70 factor (ECF subfamily)
MPLAYPAPEVSRMGGDDPAGVLPLPRATALTFEAVYEAEFDFVYRVVTRLVGPSEAEDLVQEVFLVVHRRLPEFRGDARLTTWLFQIAYRLAGAHVRRERLRRRLLMLFGVEVKVHATFGAVQIDHDEAKRVRAALEHLSFEKRSALVLHEVEGWSCEEIAESLGVPTGTVHTRLHHARRDFARVCKQPIRRRRP